VELDAHGGHVLAFVGSYRFAFEVCAARPRSGPSLFFSGLPACVAFAPALLSMCSRCASMLLTILVCCVRSKVAEANESIGGETALHETAPVATPSIAIAITVLASTGLGLAFSRRDNARLACLVCSDCDCAHATFVRTCIGLLRVFVALFRLRACLERVV
jgi:hypothetical protein